MPIMSYVIVQNAFIPCQSQLVFQIQSGKFRKSHAFNVATSQKYVDTLSKLQATVKNSSSYVRTIATKKAFTS